MAHIDRDYTQETLVKLSKEIDDYFGKDGELGFINEHLFEWGFFSIIGETAASYKRYVKSLGATRDEVIGKINKCLKRIETVEGDYSKKFLTYEDKADAYIRMANHLSDCISIKNFHNTYDFSKLHRICRDDKLEVIKLKAYDILEKDCEDWTDEDIEILAYVYSNTDDNELKEQIINGFYSDTTDKRFKSDNPHKDSLDYKYYDRNETQWEKFVKVEQYYYSTEYNKYLNGDKSVDIERVTRNNLEISYLDDNKYSVLITQGDAPIEFDDGGEIELCRPKYKEIHIGNQRNTTIVDGRPGPNLNYSYRTVKNDEDTFCVYNVESTNGEEYIKDNIKDDALITHQTNWGEYVGEKIVDKTVGTISSAADTVLPGSGKVIDIIYDVAKDEANSNQSNDPKTYQLADMRDYVDYFDLMVVHSSDGMRVMHTPDSKTRIESWMLLMEKKYKENPELYGNAYNMFVKDKSIDSYVNGDVDIYNFIRYVDTVNDTEINAYFNSLS